MTTIKIALWMSMCLYFLRDAEAAGTCETYRCPKSYSLFGKKCYKIYTNSRKYCDAEKVCNNRSNEHLATVSTAEVQAFIEDLDR